MAGSMHDAMDRRVLAWLKKEGIDPNKVRGYDLNKSYGRPAEITLHMFFEMPDDIDVTGLGKPPDSETLPRVTTDNPNIVR